MSRVFLLWQPQHVPTKAQLSTGDVIGHRFCLSTDWHGAGPCIDSSHSSLNIQINYHPVVLLPSLATTSYNAADLLSKPLPTTTHHQYTQLVIGDDPTPPATLVVTATVDPVDPVVATASTATVVASTSDLVPILHPNPILLLLFPLCWIPEPLTPLYPLLRTSFKLPTDWSSLLLRSFPRLLSPTIRTLWSQGRILCSVDLSSTDTDSVDTFEFAESATAFEVLEFRKFGTATLVFISDSHSDLKSILWNQPLTALTGLIGYPFQDWPLLSPTSTSLVAITFRPLLSFIWFRFGLLWSLLWSDPSKHPTLWKLYFGNYTFRNSNCYCILTSRSTLWFRDTHSCSDSIQGFDPSIPTVDPYRYLLYFHPY